MATHSTQASQVNHANHANVDAAALLEPAQAVEAYLAACLEARNLPANLRDALKYAVLGAGKRLRPVLVVRACEAAGGEAEDAIVPAAAIEMIHCFSLAHDDLPAMDDDELRRGRPTLHVHAGEAMAILAGDALTSFAFELIATRIDEPALAAALTRELATATTDMIAGQVYDTLPPADADPDADASADTDTAPITDLERLQRIHRHKTGALLRCACRMGAHCARAEPPQLEALTHYAETVGLMFQVVDDLLDVTQSAEQLGKASHKDAAAGKLTYPGLLGIDASREEVRRLQQQAHATLEPLGQNAQPLRDLCDYMAVRDR